MPFLYVMGIIFSLCVGLIIALFIMARPEKNFELDEESYELKNQNNENNNGTTEKERD